MCVCVYIYIYIYIIHMIMYTYVCIYIYIYIGLLIKHIKGFLIWEWGRGGELIWTHAFTHVTGGGVCVH